MCNFQDSNEKSIFYVDRLLTFSLQCPRRHARQSSMQLGQSSRDDKFADEVAYNSNDFIAVCFDDQKARSSEVFFKKKKVSRAGQTTGNSFWVNLQEFG